MKHCFCNYQKVYDDRFGEYYNGRGWYFCCKCGEAETKEHRKGNDHVHRVDPTCNKEE